MIRIAITEAAFDAVAETLPFGSVGYESGVPPTATITSGSTLNNLNALRRPKRIIQPQSSGWSRWRRAGEGDRRAASDCDPLPAVAETRIVPRGG
jgi:hypothetical protein